MRMLVFSEVRLLSKTFTTHVTRKRFLSGMGAYMHIDRVLILEALIANETMVQRPLLTYTDGATVCRTVTTAAGISTHVITATSTGSAIYEATVTAGTGGTATTAHTTAVITTNITTIAFVNITRTIEFVT